MFTAGALTILLPCILPLVPIVLGVSIAGRSKWRPLLTILGMLVSFVGFTFLLLVVLSNFVTLADYIRISTYYILFMFGVAFVTKDRYLQLMGAILGGFFYWDYGWIVMTVAETIGVTAMELGAKVAAKIQQAGTQIQTKAAKGLGKENPVTVFIIGLTMGLVWVPCAGPALGFAFALVRDEPGLRAAGLLTAYGVGTAVPLLLIGYGGQAATQYARVLSRYSGRIKQAAGVLLILTALGLQYHWFRTVEVFLASKTSYGNIGVDLERKLFGEDMEEPKEVSSSGMALPKLPKIVRAPELTGLSAWHNSEPLTMASLRGKVVLIDFWTYSCINCIRTLPYIEAYWNKYKKTPFVLIGVHTPEFVSEKSEKNDAKAIKDYGLTYPVAQDNDFGTWNAFSNRYWPAKYLIDAEGYIRYTHFGEGGYEETDEAIASLLAEIGVRMEEAEDAEESEDSKERRNLTPEIYLGERSWPSLHNAEGNPSD